MAPRTRRSAPKKTTEAEALTLTHSTTTPKTPLQPSSTNPPKLFILPDNISADARIVTLAHPRTGKETRYFVCPEKGIHEFTCVAAATAKGERRSWLLTPEVEIEGGKGEEKKGKGVEEDGGKCENNDKGEYHFSPTSSYITSSSSLFIATPTDPLFHLLPALSPSTSTSEKQHYLPATDHIDTLISSSPHLESLLPYSSPLYQDLISRMDAICDTVEAGDEPMYRFSLPKLLHELVEKAKRMATNKLPESLEEKFVRKALEVPVLGVKVVRGDSGVSAGDEEGEGDGGETKTSATAAVSGTATPLDGDSQSTVSSTETAASTSTAASQGSASTAATSVSSASTPQDPSTNQDCSLTASQEIITLLRLRTALSYLFQNYTPPHLVTSLESLLSSSSSSSSSPSPSSTNLPTIPSTATIPDFTPLNLHLSHLSTLRKQALATRSLGFSDFSRKRTAEDDDEAAQRAEKKRKKEEDEKKRKASESRGVRELKKVDTRGMRKVSDFFKKK